MEPVIHDQAASDLARDYVTGDDATRQQVAATCEEQGILAALVVLTLPDALRPGFVRAMQAAVMDAG
jgi:hypothetical protein